MAAGSGLRPGGTGAEGVAAPLPGVAPAKDGGP